MDEKFPQSQETLYCQSRPPVQERPLISDEQAEEVAALFKVLSNNTRLRMIHALVIAGEMSVSQLAEAVAMKPQAVSNQLQRLVDRRILNSRRSGNNIHYRIVDPCVTSLLDLGLCLIEEAKETNNRK
ncbi:MAG: helix-turn-helix transcriptional regulator [Desulfobacterales bacterium]|nr:helix-turn-helix transcriptional regulator [Desulfobacterales bacterium]